MASRGRAAVQRAEQIGRFDAACAKIPRVSASIMLQTQKKLKCGVMVASKEEVKNKKKWGGGV